MAPINELEQIDYHILDFFYDDEDDCALTIIQGGYWFHVIVEKEKLSCKSSDSHRKEYHSLLERLRQAKGESNASPKLQTGHTDQTKGGSSEEEIPISILENQLHQWILEPVKPFMNAKSSTHRASKHQTLREWYDSTTKFFTLEVDPKTSKLHGVELEPTQELKDRMANLEPCLTLPKYILKLDIPHFDANDIRIESCTELPVGYRPSHAQIRRNDNSEETLFLKLVDPANPNPTKREIKLLHAIAKKGLHDKIQCPQIKGLVTNHSNGNATLLGFLQTAIPNHVPLTTKLDSSAASQKQREQWAREAERINSVLHDNGLVWGDAKADNFLVEEGEGQEDGGRLWIIDFGGSFTEGWVDEEIQDTEQGDDMGVEKTANALRDPERNTFDPDAEDGDEKVNGERGEKRKGNGQADEGRQKKAKKI